MELSASFRLLWTISVVLLGHTEARPRPVLRVSSHSWPAEGDSVTLSCEVRHTSLNWTFLWYRAVPSRRACLSRQNSADVRYRGNTYSVKLLSDSSRGAGGSYTLSPAAFQHTGLYVCRAERGDPAYQTEFSDVEALWVTGLSPPASLVIRPNRAQLFESESVSLSCEVQDNSTGWRLRWSTNREEESDCPRNWRSEAGPTCSSGSTSVWDRGVYWCESESGQHSNAVNITFNSRPRPVLRVSSHSWPAEGDSVTLSCEVRHTSLDWTFLWYRAVPFRTVPYRRNSADVRYRGNTYSVMLLSDSSRGAGGSYTLSPAALQHTGLYVCRAEGGDPTYQTEFSYVEALWVTGLSPPASLVIRPNRAQLFESESVSLSCEVQDNSTGWRLRWSTDREEESDCPRDWRSEAGPTCSSSSTSVWDRGVYWCESESGQHSNAVNITFNSRPRPVLRVSSHSWPAEGDSVTLSCEVRHTSLDWTFLWYRAVPFRTVPYRWNSADVRYRGNTYSVELLSDSSRGAGGSYTLSPASLEHTGLYVCRAEGGDPTYQTEFSDVKSLWVTGLSPPASLVIRPNRAQLFESESVSLSCEVQDNSTGWRLRWSTDREEESDCPRDWRSEAGPTCSSSSTSVWDRGVYWCESESGQHSNAVNITFNSRPHPVLRVSSHSWPAEGDSVTLSCEVRHTSLNWTFLWYRAVPSRTVPYRRNSADVRYRGNTYSVELLLDSRRGAGGSYTLSPAALQHTGLYVCRAEVGDPTHQTEFSDVEALWVTGLSPPASLVIRPNRAQLFESESVSLSCEVQDNSTGWRLRWSTDREEESDCPRDWRSEAGPTCSSSSTSVWDRGVYWCESESGQHSNAVNITFNSRPHPVLRVSSHSWPAEGDSVTLSCEVRHTSLNWTFLWYRAVPSKTVPHRQNSADVRYRGNTYSVELLSDSSRGAGGSYTLSPVALQHTGLYVCRAEGGDPTYQTEFSYVEALWVTGLSPPASLVIRPNRAQLFESESVSLSCEVQDNSTGWRLRWSTNREEKSDCPRDWRSEAGPTCSSSSTSVWDRGVYWCESESGQHSNAVNITFNSRPRPVLRVCPDSWPAEGDSVTLSCEVRDTSLNWTFLWYRAVPSRTVPYRRNSPDVHYRGNTYSVMLLSDSSRGAGGFYTLSPAALQHTGLYVCRAEGGDPTYQTEFSDVEALWVTVRPHPVLRVSSHSWPAEGDSVTLTCEVRHTSLNWTFLWYRAVPSRTVPYRRNSPDVHYRGNTYSVKLLSDSSRGAGGSYTLSPVALQHTGLYVCRAEGGDPTYQTDFSDVKSLWVTGLSPPASLVIRPNRAQLFESESVSLSCEVQDNSTGWRLRWSTNREEESDCPRNWRSEAGPTCSSGSTSVWDRGVYWCESETGQHSNAVKISITSGFVILESPTHPVTEGDPLTLRCVSQSRPSTTSADFYKDGSLLQSQSAGELTIPAVSKAHAGSYQCRHPELGESPESWVTVTGRESPQVIVIDGIPVYLLTLVGSLLVVSLGLLGIVTLVVICHRSKSTALNVKARNMRHSTPSVIPESLVLLN
ncbi:Fc receptor-like protein 5 isoform X1 [Alosa alosa]|uniref:Fc receptor-like protein 5 isoform X1 n=2 Tax=Alosa alosa TaxID=278164 RepID=UPI0020150EED|nr:Fc receptor-like protein 5 isoform X1 [Alosa alosa]